MKLITLTLLILASTAFSVSVENSKDFYDAIENSSKLISAKIGYLLDYNPVLDKESIQLAEEFKRCLPKLEKIKKGLIRDNLMKMAKTVDTIIEYSKMAIDPDFVSKNKPLSRSFMISIKTIFNRQNKYLEDEHSFVSISFEESSLENNLENLVSAISEEYVVSINLDRSDVDEESKNIAKAYTVAVPKLQKIEKGLRKDNRIDDAEKLHKGIMIAETYTNAEIVFSQKERAKNLLIKVNDVIKRGKKYLDDGELFVLSSDDDKKSKLEELREKLTDLEKKLKENEQDHRAYIVRHYLNALNGLLKRLENNTLNDKMFDDFVKRTETLLEKYHREM